MLIKFRDLIFSLMHPLHIIRVDKGTGLTEYADKNSRSNRTREVQLKYVPQTECDEKYDGDITDSMMCASDDGKDACQGDSGGPLVDKDNRVLVGITSWGKRNGCADKRYPGVFARISDQVRPSNYFRFLGL